MTDRRLSMRPADILWSNHPALARGAEHATLLGDPSQPGPYVTRVRASAGHRAMPHSHPEERTYTVLSGTFYLGFGHKFVDSRLEEYPEGSVVIVRHDRRHFQLAKSDGYTVQISGEGPTSVRYDDPADDPRLTPEPSATDPTDRPG